MRKSSLRCRCVYKALPLTASCLPQLGNGESDLGLGDDLAIRPPYLE